MVATAADGYQSVAGDLDRAAKVERSLLGACLRSDSDDTDGLDAAAGIVTGADFGTHAHALVWGVIIELRAANAPVTAASVYERMSAAGALKELGANPAGWLADTLDAESNDWHAVYYAERVKAAGAKRKLRHVAVEIARVAADANRPAADAVAECEQLLFGLADGPPPAGPRGAADLTRRHLDRIDARHERGGPDGLATGFADLDKLLNGVRPGQLVVIGARPGVGKTALAVGIALNVSAAGAPVYFASLEMGEAEMMDRLLSVRSGVALRAIQSRLTPEQAGKVAAAGEKFAGESFELDDSAGMTAARLSSVVRRAIRKHGTRLVVVDYLQLMTPENDRDPRHLQVGTLARRVKQLARLCGVSIVLLAQLNRESERSGGKPKLADLRESGEIETHADAVLLLHQRPTDDPVWLTDVIVAKNRNGPVGEITLAYRRPLTRFENAMVS